MLDVRMFVADDWQEKVLQFSGAGKVPVLVDGNLTIHESLAICEYIAELYPEAKLWPEDRALRARARAVSCEMHAGFSALRTAMPMNLRGRARQTPMNAEVARDMARIEEIIEASLATSSGDFLFGDFGIADCMYFPVISRFRTYGARVGLATTRYSKALFSHPLVRKLEALTADTEPTPRYDALLG
jgi:glutathione S-transferase